VQPTLSLEAARSVRIWSDRGHVSTVTIIYPSHRSRWEGRHEAKHAKMVNGGHLQPQPSMTAILLPFSLMAWDAL
jgi:hypothetical protein